ncbi:hypothetical protein H2198_008492 [Neophaeococcomyces mojaviensis]|uniref:Uncharacterized protein n=1 Tax=Neophaeococcomyces mojaviensis TaxID=3383035 RepID=A0ACC2ZXG2_9EURO|nr:hypothetical protein H2198_008492 [Knufia sp. JES_112]
MVLENVLASISDVQVNGNSLAVILFEVASTLHTPATELRRVAIEISTFSAVLPQLGTTLQSAHTPKPTESFVPSLLKILKRSNNVLHSIEEVVALAKAENENHEIGSPEHPDNVRPLLKSAQMTVHRLSLEALRLAICLMNAVLAWSGHWSGVDGSRIANADTNQNEVCAKCAMLSLRASIMQLQAIEKVSLNESAARRLSEEREYAAEMLRRIDRKPAERRHSSTPRHSKEKLADPTSVLLEDMIFLPIRNDLHSTESWVSQSTEHSLLLRKWTGIDINRLQVSEAGLPVPWVPVDSTGTQAPRAGEVQHSRRLTIFEKVAKIRSHSTTQAPTRPSDRGRLLSVQ